MAHVAELGIERSGRWSFRRRRREARRPTPFPELVHLHALWRDALEGRREAPHDIDRRYHELRGAFERSHGAIVNEYWCSNVASGAVLTAQQGRVAFHRASDWSTDGRPEIGMQLQRCDELAARASQVLTGVRRKISLELVMASAAHLLSLAESQWDEKRLAIAVDRERKNLDRAEAYYHDAATGQAQVVYFTGIAISMVAIVGLALLGGVLASLPAIDDREFWGCLAAGAVGAVVSVIQRINAGRFELEYDVGRHYVRFLGALRPLIGGVFGLTLYFAITSRILKLFELPPAGTTSRFYAFLVIAFLAGFSERWAQDTLTSLAPSGAPTAPRSRPRQPARTEEGGS